MSAKIKKTSAGFSENMDLKASDDKFKFMFEHSIVGKSFTLPSGEINVNRAFCEILGYSQAELQNKKWQDISHSDDIEMNQKVVEKILAGEQDSARFTKRYLHKNGNVVWADVNLSLRRDETGQPLYFMTEISDITARKQTEEALRESEERYKLMFESAPLAINITSGTEITYANPSYLKLFGFSNLGELKNIPPLELFTPEARTQILENIQRRAQGLPVPNIYEAECFRKDRTRFTVLMHLTRTTFADGPATVAFIIDIAERKRTEEALRESESTARALLDLPLTASFLINAQGTILDLNETMALRFGQTATEIKGCNVYNLLPPEIASRRKAIVEEVIASGQMQRYEDERQGIWNDHMVNPILDEQGKVIKIVIAAHDITEHKQAEEQLRKSEKDYRTLVENIQMGLVVHAPDTSILYSNPRASELLGLTPDQMRGKAVIDPAWHFIQKDGSRMPLDQYPVNQALSAEMPITDLVLGILRPDREDPTWVQCNAHQNMDLDGKLQQVVVTFVDITERKRAEAALRENELKYRSLFETASDAILLFTDGQWVDCNAGALKIFGCTREQIIGTHPNRFSPPTQPDGRSSEVEASQKIKLAFAGKPQSFEWEHCRADGTLFAAEVHLNRLDLEGKPYIQAIVRDVTERKQAEAALRESELTSRRMSQQLAVVHQMSAEIASGLDFEQLIERLYQQCQRIGDTDTFFLAFYDDETNMLSFPIFFKDGERRSIESRQLGNNSGLSGQIIKNRQVIYIPDTFDLPPEVTIVRQPGIPTRSIIGVPLFLNERIAGVLSMQSHKTDAYRADQVFMLELLSKQVVVAIHNSRLYQQAQQEITARKQAEKEIALRLSFEMLLAKIHADFLAVTADEVDQAILSAQRKLCEFFGTDRSALWQGSADEPEKLLLTHLCALDEIPPVPENVTTNTLFPWFTRQLLANQIVAISDLELLPPEAATDFENLTYYGDKSTLAIPFSFGDLPICGALSFAATAQPAHWSAATLAHCGLVAQVFSGVLARKKVEDEVRKLNAELEARVEERTLELRKAQEQLIQQERLSVLGRLASGVAHELRNPLGVISNAVYFLKLILPDANEKVREYLNILADESQTASKFAADLLNYSDIQSGDRYPVAVLELVDLTLTHHPAPAGVTVQLDIPADLPPAYVDTRQIVQVLDNLVLNAYQAMLSPTGMISDGKLTISAREINNMLAIAIRDTGEGIQPENITRVFEPLFSSKPRGIGLGLPISQKLAEVNGGKIEVESEPGKGSTFIVNLPIKAEGQA